MINSYRIRYVLESIIEHILRVCFFWTSSEIEFGTMVMNFHNFLCVLLYSSYIFIRLFRVQIIIIYIGFFISSIIWTQHLIFKECLLSRIEKRILKKDCSLMASLNLPQSNTHSKNIMFLLSSILLLLMGLELMGRLINS